MSAMSDEPFEDLRAREFIGFSFVLAVVIVGVGARIAEASGELIVEELVLLATYGPASLWLFWKLRRHRVDSVSFFGRLPEQGRWLAWSGIVIGLLVVAIGSLWLVYYPLSFVLPEFVEEMLLSSDEPVFVEGPSAWPFLHRCVMFVSMVIVAPVVEEAAFRGFLLHRWRLKWGAGRAVVLSSILFGLLHVDFLGAIFFGVVMSSLYVQTRTLWVPVFCHAANNLAVFVLVAVLDDGETMTIREFQESFSECRWFLAAGAAWAVWYGRYMVKTVGWELPNVVRAVDRREGVDA